MADDLVITEGISGLWHYHLSPANKTTRALCGTQVMHTAIMRKDWRVPFGEHFPKRPTWCAKCEAAAHIGKNMPAGGGHG